MAEPFQPKFVDLVRNYTSSSGTDDFVLGAAMSGYSSFADACAPGDQFYYAAIGIDKPAEREVGRGTLLADGTIGRAPAAGTKTNFSSGTKSIALVAAAEWFAEVESLRATAQPIAVSDFKTGIYSLNGKPAAYGDLWGADVGIGAVVPGVGWTYTATAGGENYIPATQALNDAVGLPGGFTAVMDCSINTPDVEGSRSVAVAVTVYNDPADNQSALAGAFHDPPSSGGSGGFPPYISTTNGSAFQYITLGDVHRLAANLGPADEYISVDGGPVQHAPAVGWGPEINAIYLYSVIENSGFGPQTIVVERVKFYPLLDPEKLPELSARPLPTPSALSERIALAQLLGTGVVLKQGAVPIPHTGDTAEAVLATVTIPANAMGENGRVVVEALFSHSPNANAKTPRIRFGGTIVGWGFPVNVNTASSRFGSSIQNRSSLVSQVCLSPAVIGPYVTGTSAGVTSLSADTSHDVSITITAQLAVATDTMALESFSVTLFPAT